ncbi:MAG: hypothetical protein ABEI06_10865 [Halobacteriaceae archaeon]
MDPASEQGVDNNRYEMELRRKEIIDIGPEDVVIRSKNDQPIRIEYDNITEISHKRMDWFLMVLSAVVVVFGILSLRRTILGGIAFLAFGLISIYWTYRKRQEIKIFVTDRGKPITIYPDDGVKCYRILGEAMDTIGNTDSQQ